MATEVHNKLVEQQTGQFAFDEIDVPNARPIDNSQFAGLVVEDEESQRPNTPLPRNLMFDPSWSIRNRTVSAEAAEAGWGSSRYDRGDFQPEQDLEHRRAIEQPGFWKIMNGAAKGGTTMLSTAVTTTAGIIDGLLEGGVEFARQIAEGEPLNLGNIGDAAVNNFVANEALKLEQLSESWFPNYRTMEERSDKYQEEWWKHIGTANFIGDSFLKNFGFTVGAMVGGAGWSKMLGKSMAKGISGDLMRGVVASAQGDAAATEALQGTLKAIQSGAAKTVDANVLAANIKNAARQVNKMNSKLQLFGSVISAMGEGTMEGTMARDEFMQDFNQKIKDHYIQALNNLDEDVLAESKDYGADAYYIDENGEMQPTRVLNTAGQNRKEERKKELAEQYSEIIRLANEEADRLASTTFLLNTMLLVPSNAFQFGRMFAGGWKTAKNNLARVAGRLAYDSNGKPIAKYGKRGNAAIGGIANSLKVAATEATEELLQGYVSSGEKRVAENRLSSFNDDGYDREINRSLGEWFRSMNEGGWEYLSDSKNWQEGFLGAVTGLLGIPGRHWNGGVPGAIRESKAKAEASRTSADVLNRTVNSQEFRDRWLGYVRHQKYDRDMAQAVVADDQYAWHGADDKQLINDVLMFADAGRLQDLYDIVDSFASISDEQAKAIGVPEAMSSKETEKDVKNNEKEYINKAREKATDIKDVIDQYTSMYDALQARMPITTSPEHLRELLFTTMQVKRFEKRFLDLFGETMKSLEPVFAADVKTAPGMKGASDIAIGEKLQEIRSVYAKAFTGNVYPGVVGHALYISTIDNLKALKQRVKDMPELKSKVDDMIKLTQDRQKFYDKMVTLEHISSEEFESKAQTPEKINQEIKKEEVQQQTSGMSTINDVKNAFNAVEYGKQDEFVRGLEPVRATNPAVDEFIKLYRTYNDFREYMFGRGANGNPLLGSLIRSIFRNASGEQAFLSLAPEAVPSFEAFQAESSSVVRGGTKEALEAAYFAALNSVRSAMPGYLAMRGKSAATNNASQQRPQGPQPMSQMPKSGPTLDMLENPLQDGKGERDAPQPGNESQEPAGFQPGATAGENPAPQKQEKPEPEPVAEVKTEEELVPEYKPTTDTLPAGVDVQDEAQQGKMITYYRTGMPEIDSKQAKKAREAFEITDPVARKMHMNQVNLANLPTINPGFEKLWQALYNYGPDNNAFENVAKRVKKGDMVKFVIDRNFPNWKEGDEHQSILVCLDTGNDDEYIVLSTLSEQTDRYLGLADLRKTIMEDYRATAKPGERYYTFPKRSTVFFKQNGVINYLPMYQDRALVNTPGYESSDPIVFIDKSGTVQVVRGDKRASRSMYGFNIPSNQPNFMQKLRGNMYYLVKDARGNYIPIRLNVEHFKPESLRDSDTFNSVRESISKISKIAAEAISNYGDPQLRETALQDGEKKMHTEISKLKEILAMNDIFLTLGVSNNGTPLLKTIQNYGSGEQNEIYKDFNLDQLSNGHSLEDWFESLGKSFNVKAVEDEFGNISIPNLSQFISEGIITTNAEVLWPKGSDFYFQPWIKNEQNPRESDFQKTKTSNTAKMLYGDEEETLGFNQVPKQTEEPVIQKPNLPEDSGREMPEVRLSVKRKFSELTEAEQNKLIDGGIEEEEFNSWSAQAQQKYLSCAR